MNDTDDRDNRIKLTYTNHRGETSTRTIIPVMMWYGKTEHHPEPQWLLDCYDFDKVAQRTYALKDCDFTYA